MPDTKNKKMCLVCGESVITYNKAMIANCDYCGVEEQTFERCLEGHFVCGKCEEKGSNIVVTDHCLKSDKKDPIELSLDIMRHPAIKMHGPVHHYIVPAVMLTSYYNRIGKQELLKEKLKIAEQRAGNVKGGSCGTAGACGAAIGSGIFIAITTNSTPTSEKGFKLSNKMTARCLDKISDAGGPRCCKRDTFISLKEAMKFMNENFETKYEFDESVTCEFYRYNNECKHVACVFYGNYD